MVLDVNFMPLDILKLEFFRIPWIHYKVEWTITKIVENYPINVILSYSSHYIHGGEAQGVH